MTPSFSVGRFCLNAIQLTCLLLAKCEQANSAEVCF